MKNGEKKEQLTKEKKGRAIEGRGKKRKTYAKKTKLTTTESTQHVVRITSFILQNLTSQRLLLENRIPIDSLLEPRQSLINTHLPCLLLAPPLPTFRRRKPRRSTKSRTPSITLRLPNRLAPNQTLKFVEVCTGVHSDVHFHKAGLGFEAEVCGACAIAVVVGLTAVAVWVLQEVDLLELAGGDEDVVFGDDGVVVFHVFCS
jgi:hypothetical protein